MTDKVQKIREEVVRMHNLLPIMDGNNISINYADRICTTLEMYIDSLQEEPVSEDMWETSKQYALRQVLASTDTEMSEQAYLNLRLFSGFELAVAHKDGANWKEHQLMAKTVDATVHIDAGGYPYIPQMELYDYDNDISLAKEGDKYKVVLIKEE